MISVELAISPTTLGLQPSPSGIFNHYPEGWPHARPSFASLGIVYRDFEASPGGTPISPAKPETQQGNCPPGEISVDELIRQTTDFPLKPTIWSISQKLGLQQPYDLRPKLRSSDGKPIILRNDNASIAGLCIEMSPPSPLQPIQPAHVEQALPPSQNQLPSPPASTASQQEPVSSDYSVSSMTDEEWEAKVAQMKNDVGNFLSQLCVGTILLGSAVLVLPKLFAAFLKKMREPPK